MIKKLILISVILALAITLGLVGTVKAAGDDLTFGSATTIDLTGVSGDDLIISAGSKVESMTVGASTITMTLASGSTITFTSATGQEMVLNPPIAAVTYTVSGSSLTITYDVSNPTVVLSLTGQSYAPVISTVVVTNTTTVTVTFDKNIDYVFDSNALIAAGTTFATVAPTSTSISGADLVLTFASGALAAAGVKDDSKLVLLAGQIKEANRANTFLGTSTQVVTTLSGIDQLYDFTFAVQVGQNFMSIPYDVSTTLVNSYTEGTAVISIQTIDNGGGDFQNVALATVPTPTSFDPLYGYYINSDTALSLRLNKEAAAAQSPTFVRVFLTPGWHIIGVASDNVANCLAGDTDEDILSSLAGVSNIIPPSYDRVVDMSVGQANDDNQGGVCASAPECTYDTSVYKALLSDAKIVGKTKDQIDTASSGIEFNHGEAYFIYITIQNAVYNGEKVATANLVK